MHKFKLLNLIFAAMCMVAFTSCKDDDDDVSPNVSLLTNGEWTGNAVYYLGQDVSAEYEEQTGMDILQYTSLFNRDGTYSDQYAGAPLVDGTWEYGNDERVIIFDEGTRNEYTVVISKLEENELWYLQGGIEYRFTRQ
ncbi:hypothetical protein [Pontibacter litorisediminis]|uniref:hypothetical protein n=1 Tax=Pontibacter litorisediminis TaxID=1846260 RepID=UPI0023EA8629|nr:hypothetical protein [Pontibacter litorisediminis]